MQVELYKITGQNGFSKVDGTRPGAAFCFVFQSNKYCMRIDDYISHPVRCPSRHVIDCPAGNHGS